MIYLRKTLSITALTAALLFMGPAQAADWMKTLKGAIGTVTQDKDIGTGAVMDLSAEDLASGLKEALRVGTDTVTGQLGTADGFNADPLIHIPLPEELQAVQSTLRRIGLSSLADEVELKLNRGAEAAMPRAKELVWKAIDTMTLEDAKAIYDGPENAATQYFQNVATKDLEATVRPVIDAALKEVGAVSAYEGLVGQYRRDLPFVPDLKADLTEHATTMALNGLFHYLAREEAAIRQDPAKRTTEILTKVFGAK